ncbi:MAG: hypothetical protein QM778_13980 [Myxococcales bacterium]
MSGGRAAAIVYLSILMLFACSTPARPIYPERRAGRGDSCLTLNECQEPLLCIAGRCLDVDLELETTGRQCAAVECLETRDCCPPPPLPTMQHCEAQAALCTDGNPLCLQAARQPCECSRECQDYWCADTEPPFGVVQCTEDWQCGGAVTCVNGVCTECSADPDCGPGYTCTRNRCVSGCTRDEECGALARCDSARCVYRPCVSNLECVNVLGVRDAECREGTCGVPCEDDGACVALGPASQCVARLCQSTGCQQNADCAGRPPAGVGLLSVCLDTAEALRAMEHYAPGGSNGWTQGAVP